MLATCLSTQVCRVVMYAELKTTSSVGDWRSHRGIRGTQPKAKRQRFSARGQRSPSKETRDLVPGEPYWAAWRTPIHRPEVGHAAGCWDWRVMEPSDAGELDNTVRRTGKWSSGAARKRDRWLGIFIVWILCGRNPCVSNQCACELSVYLIKVGCHALKYSFGLPQL